MRCYPRYQTLGLRFRRYSKHAALDPRKRFKARMFDTVRHLRTKRFPQPSAAKQPQTDP